MPGALINIMSSSSSQASTTRRLTATAAVTLATAPAFAAPVTL
ncbi:Putative exported protein [Corynebacterium diphtheriae]|uniref:Exported protein n=1 Tax=Corynebacterium diphtheriae (strain ATCC 700971 / NCTC 13129 / Biotype gravis) TaxID=257309 RepID=Q6NK08_CORDI|nr:hypothetical protein CDHC04_0145 [Corynebacterium diphtheriae HC04]CAE48737.1 Putative exported protein [Corynebacterium diphtheriae]